MKRKPKRRKYACLKINKKHFTDRQAAYLLSENKYKWIFKGDLEKKWPTMLDAIHKKITHKEYKDLFLGHFIHQDEEDNDDERKI